MRDHCEMTLLCEMTKIPEMRHYCEMTQFREMTTLWVTSDPEHCISPGPRGFCLHKTCGTSKTPSGVLPPQDVLHIQNPRSSGVASP
jgi:hypothetical protein